MLNRKNSVFYLVKQIATMKPREYQENILNRCLNLVQKGKNPIIELDCGLGKRFLQLSLVLDKFKDSKILLILQASSSLYETYNYFKKHAPKEDVILIDSRFPSKIRDYKLREHRVILALPQTLENTYKKYPDSVHEIDLVVINEVDLIVRRMGIQNNLKIPYNNLLKRFKNVGIIGMSGTLRDEHYIFDSDQMKIKDELQSLKEMIQNSELIEMDSIKNTDVNDHFTTSNIIPTSINDVRMSLVSMELEFHIDEIKDEVMQRIMEEDPTLFFDIKSDASKLFGPLPIEPDLINKLHSVYLGRKYLWAMSSEKSKHHLIRLGMDKKYVYDNIPGITGKFWAVNQLIKSRKKSVVLCSYLDTVNLLSEMLTKRGIRTVIVSGQVSQSKRAESLDKFRESDEQTVAILSNVGERDLDIPEAELLIIFDLINTTKTVYQKLKRSRGGECRILYYSDTKEERKTFSVIKKIQEKYPWSTRIMPKQMLNLTS